MKDNTKINAKTNETPELNYEGYYAGKNDEHKESDNLMFKKMFKFLGIRKRKINDLADPMMVLYLQNNAILSTVRHLTEEVAELNELVIKLSKKIDENN